MKKVDNMKEQMGNISRKIKTLIKNWGEMLEIKNTVTKVNNAFYGLINRLDMVEERLSELEEMSIKTSITKMQRKIMEK